ncbi:MULTISPECIES: helix-turn-helix domain-containing protein [Nostoc]|uniref:Helix-turn-helix domain-containing protein n=2 Tax=Nostoc TaxID=1177 RepID=A0ABR8II80_9NOSO|nr:MULTISPECIES: helix-turn-helix domain-containing protein [Nostoc]MBD2563964.1 helix-turn-helix domain-containing protein [Nostoc linckia FACHB-391]MBD2650448.1 helix-turn-helix domain-containing protein [Nostoc foliaceum FACHB-393]
MLNPQAINPLVLPSVSLKERSQLPTTPCIYFAIDSNEVVQYIGRSINPAQRWVSHHKRQALSNHTGVRIAYLEVEVNLLHWVELALIRWFNPPLNYSVEFNELNSCDGYVSRIAKLREEKNLTQRQIAEALGLDVSTVRNWEKSRDGVKMFVRVAKLCELLNCEPKDLYEAVEPEEDAEL